MMTMVIDNTLHDDDDEFLQTIMFIVSVEMQMKGDGGCCRFYFKFLYYLLL